MSGYHSKAPSRLVDTTIVWLALSVGLLLGTLMWTGLYRAGVGAWPWQPLVCPPSAEQILDNQGSGR